MSTVSKDKKVILITGASSGIGLKTALDLLEQGHTVYGGARRVEAMKPITDAGGIALALDVTVDASMTAAVDKILTDQGRIDALVNNAGYGLYGAVEDVPMDRARAQMEVNIFGLARMTQLVLPHMRAQKAGRIVNISSVGGTIHMPLGAWYHGSKFMVEGFSNSLRVEVQDKGIDVVVVAPGAIQTEFFDVMGRQLAKAPEDSAYTELAQSVAQADQKIKGSKPTVISKAIQKAILSPKPRTIYRAGQGSVAFYLLRRILPHRLFDRMLMASI